MVEKERYLLGILLVNYQLHNMDKNGDIIIGDWQKGIGESPYTGFAMVANCDIHEPAGVLKIAPAPTKISSTTVTALISWLTDDPDTSTTAYGGGYLDDKVYSIADNGTVTSVSGVSTRDKPGGIFWKGYLIVAGQNTSDGNITLDGYDGSTWDLAFANTGTGSVRTNSINVPMFAHPAESDSLYIGADNNIAKLTEDTTFDPGTGATFTFTASALDLPPTYSAESLTQLGGDLMIGASVIGGSYYQHSLFNGQIFPWDRVSSSFSLPVSLEAGGVNQLINKNNNLFYVNGEKGRYFVSNGVVYSPLNKLAPFHGIAQGAVGTFFSSAVEQHKSETLFGISIDASANFSPAGVYGYKDGAWRFLEISTGEKGENALLYIGAIKNRPESKGTFLVSWQDNQNTAFGIDEFGKDGYRYTGYKAYVETQLYRVGTSRNKRSYTFCEVILGKELATGQGVRLKYRKNLTDDWTTIKTIDFATYGAISSYDFGAEIQDAVTVQFRIELTTGASSTTTPELLSVIFQ